MSWRRPAPHADEGPGYWPTFVDIMSVVVMVVLFVLIVSFVQTAVQIEHRVSGRQVVQDIFDRRLEITRALEEALGKDVVSISSDGNITFKGDVLFFPDSAELRNTAEVETLMTRLANSIGNVVEQQKFRDGLQMILVEGHTAEDGQPAYTHWSLSAERARRIILKLQEKDARLREADNAQFLGAAGRAHYRPAVPGATEAEKAKNRRVEIRMVLKDEGLRDALLEALTR
ncbi:MAG: flagellar motor protein MotB [Symbiobacteriaceae bacterium]|jgi:chemotaxis protein MotB|nr:flagellar motor protein MotB [Symbiobacteriaceae bacterium]